MKSEVGLLRINGLIRGIDDSAERGIMGRLNKTKDVR